MPSKEWEKVEGKQGVYRRKRKNDSSKYEYLCVYSLGYTEEYDEKAGRMRKKENRSQKIFLTLKEAEGFQGSVQKNRGKVQKVINISKLFIKVQYEIPISLKRKRQTRLARIASLV